VLHDVGSFSELAEGKPVAARVGGREILVVRWREEVFAVRNVCPHQTQSLAPAALVRGRIKGERVGAVDVADDEPVVVCPWHQWQYDLRSGQCTVDPNLRIKSYTITQHDDRLLIEVPD
jgi:nitrite reductase/ring-hydroxylating ferredoxin subunit